MSVATEEGEQKTFVIVNTEVDKVEYDHFKELYTQMNKNKKENRGDILHPRILNSLSSSTAIERKLKEVAKDNFLAKMHSDLLRNDELQDIWSLLESNSDETPMMFWSSYQKVAALVNTKAKRYFTARTFMKLARGAKDPYGRISVIDMFNFVMKKTWYDQTFIGLAVYDCTGQGYLNEHEFEQYVSEILVTLNQPIEESFKQFYVCLVVRKFFFFVSVGRNVLKILDILACGFLDDLLELREEEVDDYKLNRNWFSLRSAFTVYHHYLRLDKNQNGLLDRAEMANYGMASLSNAFLDRLFDVVPTYGDREIDFKGFLDFTLAIENRNTPQGLAYLFRILDITERSYITDHILDYFFRSVLEKAREHGVPDTDLPKSHDVLVEIIDMIGPNDAGHITLKDFERCKQGGVVMSMLIDANGFWSYENRETIIAQQAANQTASAEL